MELFDFDFIDFGASKGGCIELAKARLGGTKGIGVDIDPKKVEQMLKDGYDCVQGDITNLDLPPNSVRFVTMSHVLEHLPDLPSVRDAVASAANIASDFLFIQGPYFDADEYLKNLGLRFFWSYWSGHRCHLKTEDLRSILSGLGLDDFIIQNRFKVKDSNDPAIHPLKSPKNSHEYDPDVHPEKPFVRFTIPIYKEIVCYVRLGPVKNWDKIIQARKGTAKEGMAVMIKRRNWFRTKKLMNKIFSALSKSSPKQVRKREL
jgi:hypothetical protein